MEGMDGYSSRACSSSRRRMRNTGAAGSGASSWGWYKTGRIPARWAPMTSFFRLSPTKAHWAAEQFAFSRHSRKNFSPGFSSVTYSLVTIKSKRGSIPSRSSLTYCQSAVMSVPRPRRFPASFSCVRQESAPGLGLAASRRVFQ